MGTNTVGAALKTVVGTSVGTITVIGGPQDAEEVEISREVDKSREFKISSNVGETSDIESPAEVEGTGDGEGVVDLWFGVVSPRFTT